jgi:polysaccharide biosynthesis/export protein
MLKSYIIILILILLGTSCIHNKIRYIRNDREKVGPVSFYPNISPNYLVKKKDILYVRVISSNDEVNKLFNANANSSSIGSQGTNPFYLSGYTVNDSGSIILPIVGEIHVEGKNISEIRDSVSLKVRERVNNVEITVSLVSFYLTFIGEFNHQGKISVMQDKINMLEAISLAGGISDYGDKRRILVLRQTDDGTATFRVDLTKRSLLVADNYFLRPDDILIAEPMKNKSFQLGVRDYSMVLATVTSTITMVFLVINLLK